jgi:hypothetical protein
MTLRVLTAHGKFRKPTTVTMFDCFQDLVPFLVIFNLILAVEFLALLGQTM